MSLAKKCDRCGNLYEPKNINVSGEIVNGLGLIIRGSRNDNVINQKLFDLCPECLVSLASWLKNEPMTFNEIRKAFAQLYSEKKKENDDGKEM